MGASLLHTKQRAKQRNLKKKKKKKGATKRGEEKEALLVAAEISLPLVCRRRPRVFFFLVVVVVIKWEAARLVFWGHGRLFSFIVFRFFDVFLVWEGKERKKEKAQRAELLFLFLSPPFSLSLVIFSLSLSLIIFSLRFSLIKLIRARIVGGYQKWGLLVLCMGEGRNKSCWLLLPRVGGGIKNDAGKKGGATHGGRKRWK